MGFLILGAIVAFVLLGLISKVRTPGTVDMARNRHDLSLSVLDVTSGNDTDAGLETAPQTPAQVLPLATKAQRESNEDTTTEPVTVFETFEASQLLVAKSVLEAAEIPYYAKGEAVQDLIGLVRIWGGNLATGPVALQVPADLAAEASAFLDDLFGPRDQL